MPIYGTAGNDNLPGTANGDDIYGYAQGTANPDAETGNDSLSGFLGNDRLYGGGGNDTLDGGGGFDQLFGGAGDDVLRDGGTGIDDFFGGAGNDLFLVSGSGNDDFFGGTGTDTLRLEGDVTWSRLFLNAAAGVELLDLSAGVVNGTSGNDTFDLSGVQTANYGGRAIEMFSGTNTFIGHGGADHVRVTGGLAEFTGGGGNDILNAQNARVDFNGGDGDDLLLLSGAGSGDTVQGGSGTDTVRLTAAAERRVLVFDAASSIEQFDRAGFALIGTINNDTFDFSGLSVFGDTGPMIDLGNGEDLYIGWSGTDRVNGGFSSDTLIGNDGNDRLDGGGSADLLQGGAGNDRYIVDTALDVVDETGASGIDTVQSTVTISLAESTTMRGALENLVLTGTLAINGTGNALDNRLTGNAANNALFGGSGDDTLSGGVGNDRLVGGSGQDRLLGGKGNDTYSVDSTGDAVVEKKGQGTDTVISTINHKLAANVENLVLSGQNANVGTGNGMANRITGNGEDNRLSGAGGNDQLAGAAGDDILSGGLGRDRLSGGAGQDLLIGQGGADSFVFDQPLRSSNIDHIRDFSGAAKDRILLEADIFRGLGRGQLDEVDFRGGGTASGREAQLIYDRDTGKLFYDPDGAGRAQKSLFAILDNRAALDADDIFLI